jgi:hypothetical protein
MEKTFEDLSYQVILLICNDFFEFKNEVRNFCKGTHGDGKKGLICKRTKYPLKEYYGRFKKDRFKKVFCVFRSVYVVGFNHPAIDKKYDSIDSLKKIPCSGLHYLSLNYYFKDNMPSDLSERYPNFKKVVVVRGLFE